MDPLVEMVLEGTADEAQTLSYVYLPFEVPEGTGRIDVEYSYSAAIGSDPHLTGGNTVDIGIFDPRGIEFMSEGYRGWSGSARRSFFIARDEATPGYLPGPIQAGTWHICLGLYKVAPEGCQYEVKVQLSPAESESAVAFPVLLPLRESGGRRKESGWYKGELHCHTYHSDGDSDPADVVRVAESLGLDFLAITDHNNRSQLAALNTTETPLMLIPGYEVTTYYGHWNIWGDEGWIDFRILSPERMHDAMQEAIKRGYLVSCNHPRPYGPEWVFTEVEDYACVEVWNGPWELFNHEALRFWEARLREGKRRVAVGGSDAHFHKREHIARIGQPTTWIYCPGEPSSAGLLAALRKGHAFISESPTGAQLHLSAGDAMMGDTIARPADGSLQVQVRVIDGAGLQLDLIGANGCLARELVQDNDQSFEFVVALENTSYIRAQLVKPETEHVCALTNPIYV
jgi:hypothetical protein